MAMFMREINNNLAGQQGYGLTTIFEKSSGPWAGGARHWSRGSLG